MHGTTPRQHRQTRGFSSYGGCTPFGQTAPLRSHSVSKGLAKPPRGFSLIELLVSVALFAVVMTVSVGTLLALVDANQKAQSLKSVMNNLNFALDSITRTIRTGREFYCTNSVPGSLPDGVADCENGASAIIVTDDRGKRVAFRLNASANDGAGAVERKIDSGQWIALTAPEVNLDDLRFYVTGTASGSYDPGDASDAVQPTVTVAMRGRAGTNAETETAFNLQTTITQWLLDQ